jgi:hypothetical protein
MNTARNLELEQLVKRVYLQRLEESGITQKALAIVICRDFGMLENSVMGYLTKLGNYPLWVLPRHRSSERHNRALLYRLAVTFDELGVREDEEVIERLREYHDPDFVYPPERVAKEPEKGFDREAYQENFDKLDGKDRMHVARVVARLASKY